ncbi:ribonuclease H-like domain-containing protein [Aspergillus californicus]
MADTAPELEDRLAAERALQASKGHPNALQSGKWSIIPKEDHSAFLTRLTQECHDSTRLQIAGFNTGSSNLPPSDPKVPKRAVVALDCEMFMVQGQDSCLAQVCAVDVLTGQPILDILVDPPPSRQVLNYKTEYSGLSQRSFDHYRKHGMVFNGAEGARQELFKYVDRSTIFVGHALHNDLCALGITHGRIFDTQMLTKNAVLAQTKGVWFRRQWSLRDVARELIGRHIQTRDRTGHDCLEDCYAPREILIWYLQTKTKERLDAWAVEKIRNNEHLDRSPGSPGPWSEAWTSC